MKFEDDNEDLGLYTDKDGRQFVFIDPAKHPEYQTFINSINACANEDQLIEFIRNDFDRKKMLGENPLTWIDTILENLEIHFQDFPARFRPVIQESLSKWRDYYSKRFDIEEDLLNPKQIQAVSKANYKEPKKLLENLRTAFADKTHIDRIVKALIEKETPNEFQCQDILISNRDFYKEFKGVNKDIGLSIRKIAEILQYFIRANNGSQDAMSIATIEKNLKRKY